MKKLFVFIILGFLFKYSVQGQNRSIQTLIGYWEAVDAENASGGLEVQDSAKVFLTYGKEKKAITSFKANFSKSPAWFDFTIQDSTEKLYLKSLIHFVNDDLIQWQVFESDIRPAYFTTSGGQMVYLKRKK
jgi:hypothetical protein